MTGAVVTEVPVPSSLMEESAAGQGDVLVLPVRVDANGNGVYPEETLFLVKRLAAAGASASYLHGPEQRLFEGRKGVIADAVATLILGIVSTAAWDGVKLLLGRRSKGKLRVTFGQVERGDAGSARWWQVDGDGTEVIEAIDKLLAGDAAREPAGSGSPSDDSGQGGSPMASGGAEGAGTQPGAKWCAVADGSDSDIRAAYLTRRREDYLAEALSLRDQASELLAGDPKEAEQRARAALDRVVRAFWWAEDRPEEEPVHELTHELGRWVRETFGCTILPRNGRYEQRCPVAIAHKRMGMSIGFTAQRLCSLCGEDISECQHMPGTAYLVPGGIGPAGICPVCLSETCEEHYAAHTYRVSAIARVVSGDLQEISLVDRPAQPEARLTSIPLPTDKLQDVLGPGFTPGMPVSCDKCLSGCWGFTTLSSDE